MQRSHETRGKHLVRVSDRRKMALPGATVSRPVRGPADRERQHHGGKPRQGPHQQRDRGRAR